MLSASSITPKHSNVRNDDGHPIRLRDNYAAAMVGRFGLKEPSALPGEVTAAGRHTPDIVVARRITLDFIKNSDDLQIGPDRRPCGSLG